MSKQDGWIDWDPNKPPAPGTVVRLKFVSGVVSNPITIQDGRGLAWGNHTYSWSPHPRNSNNWRISKYQIL